jgi:hypothetical protein
MAHVSDRSPGILPDADRHVASMSQGSLVAHRAARLHVLCPFKPTFHLVSYEESPNQKRKKSDGEKDAKRGVDRRNDASAEICHSPLSHQRQLAGCEPLVIVLCGNRCPYVWIELCPMSACTRLGTATCWGFALDRIRTFAGPSSGTTRSWGMSSAFADGAPSCILSCTCPAMRGSSLRIPGISMASAV